MRLLGSLDLSDGLALPHPNRIRSHRFEPVGVLASQVQDHQDFFVVVASTLPVIALAIIVVISQIVVAAKSTVESTNVVAWGQFCILMWASTVFFAEFHRHLENQRRTEGPAWPRTPLLNGAFERRGLHRGLHRPYTPEQFRAVNLA
jgi:hypothetical protein